MKSPIRLSSVLTALRLLNQRLAEAFAAPSEAGATCADLLLALPPRPFL